MRTGFWFVPLVMLALATTLALTLLYVDQRVDPGIKASLAWAYSGGPEGARSLLSTIAGSMITAASVTFSLASVALSIASQQYGSRVLRNFMRDSITQVLLGTFISTFVYSVVVVRAIRGSDFSGGFVPAISVTVSIALSLASLVLLVFFIHHVSASIQASRIVRVIAAGMETAIPELYPSQTGEVSEGGEDDVRHRSDGTPVTIHHGGYLQSIDLDRLLKLATECDAIFEVRIRPGDHLVSGGELARLWGTISEKTIRAVGDAFLFGGERTPSQDIRFHFQQLTDVVIRSLSPGINDPFTAINGIDELASAIALLSSRPPVAENRRDEHGALRLIVHPVGVGQVIEETVGHIAIYAVKDRFVMAALGKVLDTIDPDLLAGPDRAAFFRQRQELDLAGQAHLVA
ncbi:MAG: DUF2254 domain-containing protein [Terriglobales bacterium]